jgi:protease I
MDKEDKMSDTLEGKHIALLATDGFEDSELKEPLNALRDAGATVTIISNKEEFTGKNGTELNPDMLVDGVLASEYDGLLLPGGVENPDHLRQDETAVSFVRNFFESHKPVAAICHAPWLLVEADVVRDRTLTSWPSLKTDIKNAGGNWVDEEVVVDESLVTSRKPEDLPAFCAKIVEVFAEGSHDEQVI